MKLNLSVLALLVAFTSAATAEGTKHITMHVQNDMDLVLIDPTTVHDQVNVKSVQSTIEAGQPGKIEFSFSDLKANKAKMYVTYQIQNDDTQTVEFKYEANSDSTGYNYTCSIVSPFPSSHNDCNDKDVHYILGEE